MVSIVPACSQWETTNKHMLMVKMFELLVFLLLGGSLENTTARDGDMRTFVLFLVDSDCYAKC